MDRELAQLHYSWVPAGPAGLQGFQVVGASSGIRTRLLDTAKRFCKEPTERAGRDGSPAEPSFGWWDAPELRIAFHRVPIWTEGIANNFAAHLLLGTKESLPAVELLRRFASPFWWRGEYEYDPKGKSDLPLVALESIEPGGLAAVPSQDVEKLFGTLIGVPPRTGIAIRTSPSKLVELLLGVADQVPEILTTHTLSTIFNAQEPACSIIGLGDDTLAPNGYIEFSRYEPSLDALEVGAIATSADRADRRAVVIVRQNTADTGSIRRADFGHQLLALTALRGAGGDREYVLKAMSSSAGFSLVIESDHGRMLMVQALLEGDSHCIKALTRLVESDPSKSPIIAKELLEGFQQSDDLTESRALTQISRLSKRCRQDFLSEMLSRGPLSETLINEFTWKDAHDVLRVAAEGSCRTQRIRGVLNRGRWLDGIATDISLPTEWRAIAILNGIRDGHLASSGVASFLQNDIDLTRRCGELSERLLDFPEVLTKIRDVRKRERVAAELLTGAGWEVGKEIAQEIVAMLSFETRSSFVASLSLSRTQIRSEEWDQLISRTFSLQSSEAIRRGVELPVALAQLRPTVLRMPGVRTSLWRSVSGISDRYRTPSADTRWAFELTDQAGRIDEIDRTSFLLAVINVGSCGTVSAVDVASLILRLSASTGMTLESAASLSLRDGNWWTQNGYRAEQVRRKAIVAIIVLVEHGYLRITKRFRPELEDPKLQNMVVERFSQLDKFEREAYGSQTAKCSKETQRWWKGVT